MRVLTSLIGLGLVILCGCAHTNAPRADHGYRTVSLPRVALAKGERIESVEIEITGAGFTAVNIIPLDWFVEVHTDAGVSYFQGEAGHGVGWLSSSDELDDFITILVYDSRNFTIEGKVFIASPDTERAVSSKGADYPMKPSPNVLTGCKPVR